MQASFMATENSNQKNVKPAGTALAGSGIVSAIFALVGASCCVTPILLVHLGVASTLVARLGWFARYQGIFFWAAAVFLAGSALLAARRRNRSLTFWGWWSVGGVFLMLAALSPYFELRLQSFLLDLFR
jgi:mercuric ion transport protein